MKRSQKEAKKYLLKRLGNALLRVPVMKIIHFYPTESFLKKLVRIHRKVLLCPIT